MVVSLLQEDEVSELELAREPNYCRTKGIEFISFPIPDRGIPASMTATEQVVRRLRAALVDGKGVAIHCRAGIGRSSLIAACILVLDAYDASSAFNAITKARGLQVPDTEAQRAWVSTFQAIIK